MHLRLVAGAEIREIRPLFYLLQLREHQFQQGYGDEGDPACGKS